MSKCSFCSFYFLIIFSFINLQNYSLAGTTKLCEGKLKENSFNVIDNKKPDLIEIRVDNNRKWQKNNFKIHTHNFPDILRKFKKNFKATIIVYYNQNFKCEFNARIRQSGDHKDHIKYINGRFAQSIDVDLKNGHINGITNFKLLIPETRGSNTSGVNYEDEIVTTEIFRALGFIAPRTSLINVKLNNHLSLMMFQEKPEKEMLEYHKRREGPILEGDEEYSFTWYEENKKLFPSISKEDEKTLMRKLQELQGGLAKQTNVNWAIKSEMHTNISEKALTKLNRIYVNFINQYQYKFFYNISMFNLDNDLLANNNKDQILEWDIFQAISLSLSRGHGLAPHNRKFYWNPINDYFEPIYYDSNVNLSWNLPHMDIPFSLITSEGIKIAKSRINKLNIDLLYNKIKIQGSSYSKKLIQKKLNQIIINLDRLDEKRISNKNIDYVKIKIPENFDFTDKHLNLSNNEIKYYQKQKKHLVIVQKRNSLLTKKNWQNYYTLHSEIVPNLRFIFKEVKKKNYFACHNENYKLNCDVVFLKPEELKKLLKGKLKINKNKYQYVGEYEKYNTLNYKREKNYNKIDINESTFYFEKDISFSFEKDNNKLIIYQKKPGAKAFFANGIIKNLDIYFYGYNKKMNSEPINYPFDIRGLTGCLSFINLKFKESKIHSSSSTCEDAINFINVSGQVNNIDIKNAYSDGLDVDFSNVYIDKIKISSAKNDCVDVSFGKYFFKELELFDCGDKALSVGEKSILKLDKITTDNANIGIASKDSSIVLAKIAKLKNLKTCLAAYNKKQEFSGGVIKIKNFECIIFDKKINFDFQSTISINNEL